MNDAPGSGSSTYSVKITIPCLAEYVSIARLAILGVAGRMPFSYDEVEDVRLAVGEACTHAVERAAVQWLDAGAAGSDPSVSELRIDCIINESSLTIDICDNIPGGSPPTPRVDEEIALEEAGIDRQHLSALLMEILVDEVKVRSQADGTCVRLVKYASQP
ncbi:MAG TPA: ATP-binding protein [Capsulimonadaceae bacterium]|nr:ATP-binding protein [Capsulimonadaceae bacterium]